MNFGKKGNVTEIKQKFKKGLTGKNEVNKEKRKKGKSLGKQLAC